MSKPIVLTTFALRAISADARLALRNVLRQRRRSILAILAIGFGVIAMMLTAGYIEWIYWANRELSTVNQLGHLQISKSGYHENGQADPYAYLMPPDPQGLAEIRQIPGVKSVAPRLAFIGLVSHGDNTLSFVGEGIDPALDPSSQNLLVVAGKLPGPDDVKGLILGAGLAANLGVRVGDTVVLLATTASGNINAVEGTVRALVSTSFKAFDDNVLRIPIGLARQLLHTRGAHLWVVRLDRTDRTDEILARLSRIPDLKGYEIVPWYKLADFYNKVVALFSRQMAVVKFIIGTIIVLSISNTMTMSVLERTVEIGTAMALGVRRRRILALFVLEGLFLGAIGGLLGVVAGDILARIISAIGIPMPPSPGMSRGFVAGILVTPSIISQALTLALLTTLLASVYPSWRASRLVIVDALRHSR
jgi:putative ABC transport system permease protein